MTPAYAEPSPTPPLRAVVETFLTIVPGGCLVHRERLACGHVLRHDPPATRMRPRRRCRQCARQLRLAALEAWRAARDGLS